MIEVGSIVHCVQSVSHIAWCRDIHQEPYSDVESLLECWCVRSDVAGEPKHVSGTSHQVSLAAHRFRRHERHAQYAILVMQYCRCNYCVCRVSANLYLAIMCSTATDRFPSNHHDDPECLKISLLGLKALPLTVHGASSQWQSYDFLQQATRMRSPFGSIYRCQVEMRRRQ
jgi:hypothetical protein